MPETRKYLRFFPRPGKKASVTIGEPITHRILPLVDRWKALAGREGGRLGVGGEWDPQRSLSHIPTEKRKELGFSKVVPDAASVVDEAYREQPTRLERWRGRVAGGEEERMRIEICDVLTEEMRRLGVSVEEEEGKAGNAWRNAVKNDGS
jgi:monolysocardiolipin acyltransferase